jgi:hypothetical protein
VDGGYADGLTVHGWTHKGVENPWIWRHIWCKEHKCVSFHAYVPKNSTSFTISMGSILSVDFDL